MIIQMENLEPATEEAIKKYCKKNGLYPRKIIDVELQKHMGFMLFE